MSRGSPYLFRGRRGWWERARERVPGACCVVRTDGGGRAVGWWQLVSWQGCGGSGGWLVVGDGVGPDGGWQTLVSQFVSKLVTWLVT